MKASAVHETSDPYVGIESSKEMDWWLPNIDHKITPEVRELLETYSDIPPEEVIPHIYAIREKAWAIRPYPCTGLGAFLTPSISKHPTYAHLLSRLRDSEATLLDIGCYLGADLRRLAADGAPMNKLYGVDLNNHWDLSFELYCDRSKFDAVFLQGDLLSVGESHSGLETLKGKMNYIHVTHVFHQWNWDTQILASKKLVALSVDEPGSLIIGFQCGTKDVEERARRNKKKGVATWTAHSPETFQKMWEIVGQETNSKWQCDAVMCDWESLAYEQRETAYLGEDIALMRLEVKRLE